MPYPTFIAAGAIAAGTTSVVPTIPAHVAGDIIAVYAWKNATENVPATATSGWNTVANNINGNSSAGWFWKRATASGTTGPTVTATGSAVLEVVAYIYRGCLASGTPFEANATAGNLVTAQSQSLTSAVITAGTSRLIVGVSIVAYDTTLANCPPASWTKDTDQSVTTTVRFTEISIPRATAGTQASVAFGDLGINRAWGSFSFALIPEPPVLSVITGIFLWIGNSLRYNIARKPAVASRFHTFELMEGVRIAAKSSQQTTNPAEHAVIPLDPTFAWEANAASAQHTITLDLGEIRTADGFMFSHEETETFNSAGLDMVVSYSLDNTTFFTTTLVGSAERESIDDIDDSTIRFKVRYFDDTMALRPITARYWKFTCLGLTAPNYYAPTDMRVTAIWLFTYHAFDIGPIYPIDDTPNFPTNEIPLSLGKTYTTGLNVNPSIAFTRSWLLNTTNYAIFHSIFANCNGAYRPFLYSELGGAMRLCKFVGDSISEELIDVGYKKVTATFIELPHLQKDAYH